jgi:hypothetical protein
MSTPSTSQIPQSDRELLRKVSLTVSGRSTMRTADEMYSDTAFDVMLAALQLGNVDGNPFNPGTLGRIAVANPGHIQWHTTSYQFWVNQFSMPREALERLAVVAMVARLRQHYGQRPRYTPLDTSVGWRYLGPMLRDKTTLPLTPAELMRPAHLQSLAALVDLWGDHNGSVAARYSSAPSADKSVLEYESTTDPHLMEALRRLRLLDPRVFV